MEMILLNKREVLILTASINPTNVPFLKISDCKIRLLQYKYSLKFWIEETEMYNIVFCDNTYYDYDFKLELDMAKQYNKKLEILKYKGNENASKYGKGYGEGEIIKYIIENSKLINDQSIIYKVTGRLYVSNFNSIYRKHLNFNNIFIKNAIRGFRADTRFFKCECKFYKNNLLEAYKLVNDNNNIYLEDCFYRALINCNIDSFKIYPIIKGKSGSKGCIYSLSYREVLFRNIFCKLNLYNIKPNCMSKLVNRIAFIMVKIKYNANSKKGEV